MLQTQVMRLTPKLPGLLFTAFLCQVLVGKLSAGEMLDVKGVKIHYMVEGKGEPVVLIHGLYSSAAINWQMPGIISLLSKDYEVIALDVPAMASQTGGEPGLIRVADGRRRGPAA